MSLQSPPDTPCPRLYKDLRYLFTPPLIFTASTTFCPACRCLNCHAYFFDSLACDPARADRCPHCPVPAPGIETHTPKDEPT